MTFSNLALVALVLLFAYLQYRDVQTTTAFLANGKGTEANPIMARWQAFAGSYWGLIKLPIVVAVAALAWAFSVHGEPVIVAALLAASNIAYYAIVTDNARIARGE